MGVQGVGPLGRGQRGDGTGGKRRGVGWENDEGRKAEGMHRCSAMTRGVREVGGEPIERVGG